MGGRRCGKDQETFRQVPCALCGDSWCAHCNQYPASNYIHVSKIFLWRCAMNRLFANTFTCVLIGLLSLLATAQNPSSKQWIGTWATAPQPPEPGQVKSFRNQT